MNITVFCSSSNRVSQPYRIEAAVLGKLIAQNQYQLVYGGNRHGLMGVLAKSVKENESKVVGIITQQIHDWGHTFKDVNELIIVKNIRERKALLSDRAHAFIILPGGFGTLEEATEVINDKLFGNHNKPIVFVNTNGFYNDLIAHFSLYKSAGFTRFDNENVFRFVNNAHEAIQYVKVNMGK